MDDYRRALLGDREADSRDSSPCNYCVRNTEHFGDCYTPYTEVDTND